VLNIDAAGARSERARSAAKTTRKKYYLNEKMLFLLASS
jgi:hypothetical protein